DLAVTDLAGARRGDHGVDDLVDVDLVGHHLDLDLRQELHRVLGTPVHLGVALLPSVALYLADGQAGHAERVQGLLHAVELVRLDDRGHQLHAQSLSRSSHGGYLTGDFSSVFPPPASAFASSSTCRGVPGEMPAIANAPPPEDPPEAGVRSYALSPC